MDIMISESAVYFVIKGGYIIDAKSIAIVCSVTYV